jgi:hypothetical protein
LRFRRLGQPVRLYDERAIRIDVQHLTVNRASGHDSFRTAHFIDSQRKWPVVNMPTQAFASTVSPVGDVLDSSLIPFMRIAAA